MVYHVSLGHMFTDREIQKDFRWNTFHSQSRVVPKAKPIVEGWFTDQHATLSPQFPNGLQSFINECLTDALSLMAWGDGDRPECKPPAILPADCDRREGDLANDIAIDFGNQ